MTVRIARIEDAPAMARVIVDTMLTANRPYMPEEVWTKRKQEWTYDVSERGWARMLRGIAEGTTPRECAYVAEDEGGAVIGLATGGLDEEDASEDTGWIHALYVSESHQRHGLGRRLAQTTAAHLARLGMTALRIECLAANAPARRFYEALGGRVVEEREIDEYGFMLPSVVYGWSDTRAL